MCNWLWKIRKVRLRKRSKIKVYSDVHDLLVYNSQKEEMDDNTIFGSWVECGEKTLMMDVSIDELELFAS